MKTSLPLSTISYNSDAYLSARLDELLQSNKLRFYAYIKHLPEDNIENDDGNGKVHFHVYFEPADNIDPEALRKYFDEFDPEHPKNPLGCMPIRKSQFGDWYPYVLHNPRYLARKGLTRSRFYEAKEVKTNSPDYLHALYTESEFCKTDKVARVFEQGVAHAPFASLVESGFIGLRDMHNARIVYEQGYKKAEQEEHEKNLDELLHENDDLLCMVSERDKKIKALEAEIERLNGLVDSIRVPESTFVPF